MYKRQLNLLDSKDISVIRESSYFTGNVCSLSATDIL